MVSKVKSHGILFISNPSRGRVVWVLVTHHTLHKRRFDSCKYFSNLGKGGLGLSGARTHWQECFGGIHIRTGVKTQYYDNMLLWQEFLHHFDFCSLFFSLNGRVVNFYLPIIYCYYWTISNAVSAKNAFSYLKLALTLPIIMSLVTFWFDTHTLRM